MKNKIYLLGFIALAIIIGLSFAACEPTEPTDEDPLEYLYGEWYPNIKTIPDGLPETKIVIKKDGTGICDGTDMEWEVDNKTISFTYTDIGDVEFTDVYSFSVSNSILTLKKSSEGSEKTATYARTAISYSWPTNTVWTEYGLPGFTQPNGTKVIYTETEFYYYSTGYREMLTVELEASYEAYENLKTQLTSLGVDYDEDQTGAPGYYSLYAYYTDNYYFIDVYYSNTGSITITVDKLAAICKYWTRGSGVSTRSINIDIDGIIFEKGGTEYAAYEYFSYDGTMITVKELDDDSYEFIELFKFKAISSYNQTLKADQLVVSGLTSVGALDFTDFNGTYIDE